MKPAGRNRFACPSCKDSLAFLKPEGLCKTCLSPLPYDVEACGGCLTDAPAYERLTACVLYEGKLRTSLQRYKFGGRADLHTSFSLMLCDCLFRFGCTAFDAVIPVPLSAERLKERGYNQSELIARDIAEKFHVPCICNVLQKSKNTKRQSELRGAERKRNVRGSFVLNNPNAIRGKTILLTDDIFTTGATMREAAAVLAAASVRIFACAVAKTNLGKAPTVTFDTHFK